MNKNDAYELLVKEYIARCQYGCDSCMAEYWCTTNHLRTSRVPQKDCPEKLKRYLRERR